MHKQVPFLITLICSLQLKAQTLPANRAVDWTVAGLRDTTTVGFLEIDLSTQGFVGDGSTSNDASMSTLLANLAAPGNILQFPAGNFLFNQSFDLPDNTVIRGVGAEQTTLSFDQGGSGHSINIQGTDVNADTSPLATAASRDSQMIEVDDASAFSSGDWIRIKQFDEDLMTSSWAYNTYGQIVQITSINNNQIELASALRLDFEMSREPFIVRMNPAYNVGIECLKVHRLDDTAPQQSSNINFVRAVNCWVQGIESENCTYSHIDANYCSNLVISKSYMHHGFDYGGGGRAYGIMLHFSSNECLVENNIFEHLRHSMIMQAGANGNVFAYNYSWDPYWSSFPNDSAGDMVLHGNYPFANLFEQNICRNMVIDDSHGPNGPHNTFLRNRGEGYGIFFSASNSPNQNFLGNEITNSSFPYSLVNYSIQGSGHFLFGNNNKGSIDPSGTENLPDISYAFTQQPYYIPSDQWAGIGTTNPFNQNSIPARDRFLNSEIFLDACSNVPEQPSPQIIEVKLLLQAVMDGLLMRTELSDQNLLPEDQPFNKAPWNYSGTETIANLPANITDWVLLEVRESSNPNTIVEQHAGLLQNDGQVLALDGSHGILFSSLLNSQSYQLIIRSRNHLALASKNDLSFPQAAPYDFREEANVLGGSTQLAPLADGIYAALAGDIDSNGLMSFLDFNLILSNPSDILQYLDADINMDGHCSVEDFNWYKLNSSGIGVAVVGY